MKKATTNDAELLDAIDGAIRCLREHWVYDAAILFSDCAMATHRISNALLELRDAPHLVRDKIELLKAIKKFRKSEMNRADIAKEHLVEELCSANELERHFELLPV